MNIWQHLNHFTPDEPWGDPAKMNGLLLLLIGALRDNWPSADPKFIVHCGYDLSGHMDKSLHHTADAVDYHVIDGRPFPTQILVMEGLLLDFQVSHRVGLGIYPCWNNPGFHLEIRERAPRWGYVPELGGYIAYDRAKDYACKKFMKKTEEKRS